MSSPKKPRVDNEAKSYHRPYNAARKFLQKGDCGFLATCNFKEKDSLKEAYNLLNQYCTEETPEETPAEEDISKVLEQEVATAKRDFKRNRFQSVDTGAKNCLFIKAVDVDPVELGVRIVGDIAEHKEQKTRFLLRLIPIEVVTKANVPDIVEQSGKLFDKYFLKEPKTYSIIFNRRFNNVVSRDEVIKELADLIAIKNCKNKVDLKHPEFSVIVEVVKGLCCLSVVPNYLKWKKYNLVELCNKNPASAKVEEKAAE